METHLKCPCFLQITPLFTDGFLLIICLYGLIQFNESPDCIMIPWSCEGQVYLPEAKAHVFFPTGFRQDKKGVESKKAVDSKKRVAFQVCQ